VAPGGAQSELGEPENAPSLVSNCAQVAGEPHSR
jgi:hypothetical protein